MDRQLLEQIAALPSPEQARQQLAELDRQAEKEAAFEAAQNRVNVLSNQFDAQAEHFNSQVGALQDKLKQVMSDLDQIEALTISLANDPLFDLAYKLTSAKVQAGQMEDLIQQMDFARDERIDNQIIGSWVEEEIKAKFGSSRPLTVTVIARSDLQRMVLAELRRLSQGRLETS